MNRNGRASSHDPTAELTADGSAQSASGLSTARPGPGVVRNRDEEIVNRSQPDPTPRRYEQPLEEDPDPPQ